MRNTTRATPPHDGEHRLTLLPAAARASSGAAVGTVAGRVDVERAVSTHIGCNAAGEPMSNLDVIFAVIETGSVILSVDAARRPGRPRWQTVLHRLAGSYGLRLDIRPQDAHWVVFEIDWVSPPGRPQPAGGRDAPSAARDDVSRSMHPSNGPRLRLIHGDSTER